MQLDLCHLFITLDLTLYRTLGALETFFVHLKYFSLRTRDLRKSCHLLRRLGLNYPVYTDSRVVFWCIINFQSTKQLEQNTYFYSDCKDSFESHEARMVMTDIIMKMSLKISFPTKSIFQQ